MFYIIKSKIFILFVSFFLFHPLTSLSHDDHGKMVEAIKPYPEIKVDLINLYSPDFKLEFNIKNFKLIALEEDSNPNKNEGHILILVNNKKKIMVTDDTFVLKRSLLKKGKNEIFVMLMDSHHSLYTKEGSIIYVSKRIYNK